MKLNTSHGLLKLMIFITGLSFLLISAVLIYVFTTNSLENYNNSLHDIRKIYSNRTKMEAEDKIHKLVDFIDIYKNSLEQKEKESVKNNVDAGWEITKSIYDQFSTFPKDIIIQKIRDSLRSKRFFNDKTGYYFVYKLDGTCLLLPTTPRLEGKNQINFLDGKGEYTIRKAIKLVKAKKEGFSTWWWYKIGEKKMQKKIGFVKIFKPLGIFIGSGRYEEDILKQVKKSLKKYLSTLQKDQFGYIFAYDVADNSIIGNGNFKNINRWNDVINGRHIVRDAIRGAYVNPDGFFMNYVSKDGKRRDSYIRLIPSLNWVIGTQVKDYSKLYMKQKEVVKEGLKRTVYKSIMIAAIILVAVLVLFLLISTKIKKLFKKLEYAVENRTDELEESRNVFKKLFYGATEGLALSKNQEIYDINDAAMTIFEANSKDEILALTTQDYYPLKQDNGKNSVEFLQSKLDMIKEGDKVDFEIQAKTIKDKPIWLNTIVTQIILKGEIVRYYVFRDITQRKKIEREFALQQEKLLFQAKHDSLTSLPNRALLMDRLSQSIKKATRNKKMLAVVFLDLDNFKQINDAFGHDIGDLLLIKTSELLKILVRETDTIARFGGDEFIIILDSINSVEDISHVVQKISSRFQKPFNLKRELVKTTFSMGISMFPNDASDSQALLKFADLAMYKAKNSGKNQYVFYDESMDSHVLEHIKIENQLRNALISDEFILHYQPQFDIRNKKILGVEALVRWNHPSKGLIYPDYFIQIAEDSDIIIELGKLISKKAMLQMKEWRNSGYDIETMSINFTAKQLEDKDFFINFEKLLKQTGCSGGYIEAELIERHIMRNKQSSKKALKCFADLGVSVAIDDFGTGYSSLGYLKYLSISKLKIDKTFVDDIVASKKDKAIAKAVIDLSKGLDLKVLAEGVETKEQCDLLFGMGCEVIQGYYYSRPVSSDEIEKMLIKSNGIRSNAT